MIGSSWQLLACSSRVGAEHRRRGVPGQDNVARWAGTSGDGAAVRVLALADGHGHQRHWRSGVGSSLACGVAVDTLRSWLTQLELWQSGPEHLPRLQHHIAMELTQRIHRRWLAAVRRHSGVAQEVHAEPYGCTLAVLALTPRWWAVCGLGDWDLVGVNAVGQALLLSEEPPLAAGLEITASLCQSDAAAVMAARTQLRPLAGAPMALLLSSDGVRKSCGATADYLAWAAALLARLSDLPPDQQLDPSLDQKLDQLSARGTGDDMSVLAVSHGQLTWPTPPALAAPPLQRLPRGRQPARQARRPQGWWLGWLARRPLVLRRIALASILLLAVLALTLALAG